MMMIEQFNDVCKKFFFISNDQMNAAILKHLNLIEIITCVAS